MTREEMISELSKYCDAIDVCADCPMRIIGKVCNPFEVLSNEELEERITLIEEDKETKQEAVEGFINQLTSLTAKADAGKAPISLVPMEIVWAIAWIRKYGNEKYRDPDNWKTVEPERYRDALMRHILHYISDPKSVDEESGYPHLWHAACNIAFLMSMDYGDRVYSGDTFESLRCKEFGKALAQGIKEGLINETD